MDKKVYEFIGYIAVRADSPEDARRYAEDFVMQVRHSEVMGLSIDEGEPVEVTEEFSHLL